MKITNQSFLGISNIFREGCRAVSTIVQNRVNLVGIAVLSFVVYKCYVALTGPSSNGSPQSTKKPLASPTATETAKVVNKPAKKMIPINFIWMGDKIPTQYLRNIKECAAKALSDANGEYEFTINLWMNNPINYWKTACPEDNQITHKKFKIRDLSEIKEFAGEKYTTEQAKKINSYVCRELAGFKNFAAASDILRYLILEKEGGFYFDTDLVFNSVELKEISKGERGDVWKSEKLWDKNLRDPKSYIKPQKLPHGVRIARDCFLISVNNCMIQAAQGATALHDAVIETLKRYDSINSTHEMSLYPTLNKGSKKVNWENGMIKSEKCKIDWKMTVMDVKRSYQLRLGPEDRRFLTINTSLTPIGDVLDCDIEKKRATALEYWEKESLVLPIRIQCDNTWLKNPRTLSVDDNESRINPFQSVNV